ncbi:hypothetical protein WUBG_05385 [Wuchereria bancrofti]|uniref:Uncharacterized protein n=1 Tax=Wuchereria bancrofti TaxID=6293 RepID=J9EMJ3_WUCBA|nr:hypothetical protein WUBG_05385 [Wuchereria bancrofti]
MSPVQLINAICSDLLVDKIELALKICPHSLLLSSSQFLSTIAAFSNGSFEDLILSPALLIGMLKPTEDGTLAGSTSIKDNADDDDDNDDRNKQHTTQIHIIMLSACET